MKIKLTFKEHCGIKFNLRVRTEELKNDKI